jgi:hypothetical protein
MPSRDRVDASRPLPSAVEQFAEDLLAAGSDILRTDTAGTGGLEVLINLNRIRQTRPTSQSRKRDILPLASREISNASKGFR